VTSQHARYRSTDAGQPTNARVRWRRERESNPGGLAALWSFKLARPMSVVGRGLPREFSALGPSSTSVRTGPFASGREGVNRGVSQGGPCSPGVAWRRPSLVAIPGRTMVAVNQGIFAMVAYWVVTACLVAGIGWAAATHDARVALFVVATVVWLLASIGFWRARRINRRSR
jgi:hypothetical protein